MCATPLMPDNQYSTLTKIKNKVRRLTQSISPNQLTEDQLIEYLNSFVLYDMAEHLKLFNLRSVLTFYTKPYVGTYGTETEDKTSPLYNFVNRYLTVNPPVYVAGYEALFSQSREQFFALWPQLSYILQISQGNGTQTAYTGNINLISSSNSSSESYNIRSQNLIILRDHVVFNSIDTDGNPLVMTDFPINALIGNLRVPDAAPTSPNTQDPNNYINYKTGQFVVTFINPPAVGVSVNSQTVQLSPSLPTSMLFFDGKFVMRPVPDQVYPVTVEVDKRPAEMLEDDMPQLSEWWEFIALGTAKKVFEDKLDTESLSQMMPMFAEKMDLIQRRTIRQNIPKSVASIYNQPSAGWNGFQNGNNNMW